MRDIEIGRLTKKEQLVLAFWACGQTIKESARYLNLSEGTIEYYRSRLKCMFNAETSNELISKLIMMDEYEALIRLGKSHLIETPRFIAAIEAGADRSVPMLYRRQ